MISLLLAGAALGANPAPPTPPTPDAATKGETRQVVIIRNVGKDGKTQEKRTETVILKPGGERTAIKLDCDQGRKFETEAEATSDGKKQKTKIMLCARPGESDASYADALKRAADRIAYNKNLPEDVRTRVVAALNTEIAKLSVSAK